MIQDIRNPWIRRSVLILTLVFYVPFILVLRTAEVLLESWRELRYDVPAAWAGRKGRYGR